MENNKQSSVEWLAEIIRFANKELYAEMFEEIDQAKAMHKEEIINVWTEATAPNHEIGLSDTTYILAQIEKGEQYYNEKYGKDNADNTAV